MEQDLARAILSLVRERQLEFDELLRAAALIRAAADSDAAIRPSACIGASPVR
jgi:hypothetical protein